MLEKLKFILVTIAWTIVSTGFLWAVIWEGFSGWARYILGGAR